MTIVSNDPALWPAINAYRVSSCFAVAFFVGVTYDWTLTFGQEVEMIWRQRWSLMTVMYLGVRYLGILYTVLTMLSNVTTVSLTDTVRVSVVLYSCLGSIMTATLYCHRCFIVYAVRQCISVVAFAVLWVIIITRLHAMYQRSRKILILLVVIFLAVNIFNGVALILVMMHTSGEEAIFSGTYQCMSNSAQDITLLYPLSWTLATVLEVFAMCLAVWIAVKHFRELRRYSAGEIIGDCFAVLMKTHLLYFASFVTASCFQLIVSFDLTMDVYSKDYQICAGLFQFLEVMQMFVLGPRLILSLREYYAELVVDFGTAGGMTSIAFQERVHISTGNSV
ncbi:hypothetical protein BDR07DRAFT_1485211 [Suillus spraguei]|nr:hypothetical protein BDR07DRAFT_1485211 [Suillus spraguei]